MRGIDTRNGNPIGSGDESVRIIGQQVTWSEGHRWRKQRHVVRDIGGPFDTVKLTHSVAPTQVGRAGLVYALAGVLQYTYSGDLFPYYGGVPPEFRYGSFESGSDPYLLAWPSTQVGITNLSPVGAKFVADTIPTNPVVDGSVSLAELFREGIPSMIGSSFLKSQVGFLRGLGSEYLNFEFGWKPLVSDLKNASKAITESYEILKTLEKYSGKELRRKRLHPPTRTVFVNSNNVTYPSGFPQQGWASPPVYSTTDTTVRQQWFSGCYKYYYEPSRMTELGRIYTQARLLYGLELTPEVVWNLAPWSWLVDWFANVGPLLSNVSAFQSDGLVMKYGYVMEKTSREIRRSNVTSSPQSGLTNHPRTVTDSFRGTRKRREQASPYGFGLTSDSFTIRQWSILGALGITRGPKRL